MVKADAITRAMEKVDIPQIEWDEVQERTLSAIKEIEKSGEVWDVDGYVFDVLVEMGYPAFSGPQSVIVWSKSQKDDIRKLAEEELAEGIISSIREGVYGYYNI